MCRQHYRLSRSTVQDEITAHIIPLSPQYKRSRIHFWIFGGPTLIQYSLGGCLLSLVGHVLKRARCRCPFNWNTARRFLHYPKPLTQNLSPTGNILLRFEHIPILPFNKDSASKGRIPVFLEACTVCQF